MEKLNKNQTNMRRLFTSESVSEGHPDKIADQISDAVLDNILALDPDARVACECFTTTEFVQVGGEINTKADIYLEDGKLDKSFIEKIVRNKLKEIGYIDKELGIGCDTCEIDVRLHGQSMDIHNGVDRDNELCAGDQGIMFGFATNETKEYMPLAISIANKLVSRASHLRHYNKFQGARPDMKSQVTIDYTDIDNPKIDTVLMSIQHDPGIDKKEFREYIKSNIIDPVLFEYNILGNGDYSLLINPSGEFVIGGPHGDSGLTGRKIIVDTYGGYAKHGGGAFSGKDYTKVDRSAAYAARHAAKNLVAAGLADKLEIQLSYAIGISTPVSISLDTFGTNHIPEEQILEVLYNVFDFNLNSIITNLQLKEPIYSETSTYGHFGKPNLPWEQLNKIEDIKNYLKG